MFSPVSCNQAKCTLWLERLKACKYCWLLNKIFPLIITTKAIHSLLSSLIYSLQPLSAANEYHVQGERAGLSAGDIHFACMNRLIYSLNSYWIGHNLSAVERVLSDACLFMKDHNHKNSLQFLLMLRSTVMMLVDSDTEVPRRNELIRTLQESSTFRVQMTMYVRLF